MSEQATGTPRVMASRTGSPKPSPSVGNATQAARRQSASSSASGTKSMNRTPRRRRARRRASGAPRRRSPDARPARRRRPRVATVKLERGAPVLVRPLGADAEHEAPAAEGMLHSHAFFVCGLVGRPARTGARPWKPAGSRPRSEQISSRAAAEPVSKASALFAAGPTVSRKARVVARENVCTRRNVTSCSVITEGVPGVQTGATPARLCRTSKLAAARARGATPAPPSADGSLTLVDRQVLDLRKVRPTIPPKRACPAFVVTTTNRVSGNSEARERARADTSRGRLTARGRGRERSGRPCRCWTPLGAD